MYKTILLEMMRKFNLLVGLTLLAVVCSCSSHEQTLTYFKDIKGVPSGSIDMQSYEIKIVPDDELIITVNSYNPSATAAYNVPLTNPATRSQLVQMTQPAIQTYLVGKDGYISFPRLGKIHAAGKTAHQLEDELAKLISKDVTEPFVHVELRAFKVLVLGEVNEPGTKVVENERYTVFDALADAHDLSIYGDRTNVLVIREENGKKEFHHLNLQESSIMSSPYFFLRQNDVVYVEPNQIRTDISKYNTNNAYKLTVVSTIVSAASIIASLVIALTVKK